MSSGDELRARGALWGAWESWWRWNCRACAQYQVLERSRPCRDIDEALASEHEAPLQQFFLFPQQWRYCVQERKVVDQARSWSAPLYRLYWLLGLDVGLHVLVKLFAAWLRSRWLIRGLYTQLLPRFLFPWWKVVDRSDRMLHFPPRPVATSAYAASKPRRGMSPSSVAPRQQRFRRGRRQGCVVGDAPRQQTALSGGEQRYAGTSPAVAGNGYGARAGEEQRYAGTSPAVAGICRLVAIRFRLALKGSPYGHG